MSVKIIKFPKDFLWGSATSASQTEGAFDVDEKGESVWDHWYKLEPERFFDRRNSANDFYHNYKQDLDIAKKLNFNSLRMSIQWSRIFPKNNIVVNQKAVDYYHKVFKYANKIGLKLIITLYHFDLPMWIQKEGGLVNRLIVDYFETYAKFCVQEFKEISNWLTMCEPIVPVQAGYWYQMHWPLQASFLQSLYAILNLNLMHLNAVKEMRKIDNNNKYGVSINIEKSIPRSKSKDDVQASRNSDLLNWLCFTDTMILGKFPQDLIDLLKKNNHFPSIYFQPGDEELISDKNAKVDFLAFNYYQPSRSKSIPYLPDMNTDTITPNTHYYNDYIMPGRRMNPYRGWEVNPKELYNTLLYIKKRYNNIPVYISENGMGVSDESRFKKNGVIQDTYRINFVKEHLYWISKAIEAGCDVFGYHTWAYIDNWSWMNAYKNRYGYIELDLKTNFRNPKLSATWVSKVGKEGAFEIDLEKDFI